MVSSGVQNEGEMTLRPIVKYDDVLPREKRHPKNHWFPTRTGDGATVPSLMSLYSKILWRAPPIKPLIPILVYIQFRSSFALRRDLS